MNYLILKSIVDTTIAHFACRNCNNHISERDVTVVGATDHEVALSTHCPHCHDECTIKAEINLLKNSEDLQKALGHTGQNISSMNIELSNGILSHMMSVDTVMAEAIETLANPKKKEAIKDDDIVALHTKLKGGAVSAQDLFTNDF